MKINWKNYEQIDVIKTQSTNYLKLWTREKTKTTQNPNQTQSVKNQIDTLEFFCI